MSQIDFWVVLWKFGHLGTMNHNKIWSGRGRSVTSLCKGREKLLCRGSREKKKKTNSWKETCKGKLKNCTQIPLNSPRSSGGVPAPWFEVYCSQSCLPFPQGLPVPGRSLLWKAEEGFLHFERDPMTSLSRSSPDLGPTECLVLGPMYFYTLA